MLSELFTKESWVSLKPVILFTVISGISNCAMLGVLNSATGSVQTGEANTRLFLLFFITLLLSAYTKKVSLDRTQAVIQDLLRGMRIRIADKIRKSSLVSFESRGKEHYYVALTQQAGFISNSSATLINAAQALVVVIACLIYIGWLSLPSLILMLLFIVRGVSVFRKKDDECVREILFFIKKENEFFSLLNHILSGFKELTLSGKKSDAVYREFSEVSDQATALRIGTGVKFTETMMFSQASMYILIAGVILVFPFLHITSQETVPKLIIAVLFFWTSLESIVAAIPDFSKAGAALKQLKELEDELDKIEDATPRKKGVSVKPFSFHDALKLNNFSYHHRNKEGEFLFGIGPLNCQFEKGKIIFICGGNGSGKTTLLKGLTSLYPPGSGEVLLDEHPVGKEDREAYRQLFSVVYSDFFLFNQLYGLKNLNKKKVEILLEKLGLADKTSFTGTGFSRSDLSQGQRKRLAILIALLEDRPVCLFDEPAAELDPAFRRYFYEEFLPELREEGRTIVVITHDDRYFSCCDHLFKMESGTIREEKLS